MIDFLSLSRVGVRIRDLFSSVIAFSQVGQKHEKGTLYNSLNKWQEFLFICLLLVNVVCVVYGQPEHNHYMKHDRNTSHYAYQMLKATAQIKSGRDACLNFPALS